MFKRGLITEIKPERGVCRVKFLDDNIVSPELQIIFSGTQDNKFYLPFAINELVAVLMDKDGEDGVVLGALYNDTDAPENGVSDHALRIVFNDGAVLEYDWQLHALNVDLGNEGTLLLTAVGGVSIDASNGGVAIDGDVTIDGNVDVLKSLGVDGSVTAQGKIKSNTNVEALTVDLLSHIHSGVQPGGGVSGVPVP